MKDTSSISEDDEFSWMKCAGRVAELFTNFDRANSILTKFKTDTIPNPKIFIAEISDCLSMIHYECDQVLRYIKRGEEKLFNENENLIQAENEIPDHDPGNRKKVNSQYERRYLISLGPCQPKLEVFPVNNDIDKKKTTSI